MFLKLTWAELIVAAGIGAFIVYKALQQKQMNAAGLSTIDAQAYIPLSQSGE